MWVDSLDCFLTDATLCVATMAVDPSLPFLRAPPPLRGAWFWNLSSSRRPHGRSPSVALFQLWAPCRCVPAKRAATGISPAPWFHSFTVCVVRHLQSSQCSARPVRRCRASRMNCVVDGGTRPSAPPVQSHVADPAWGTSRSLTLLGCMARWSPGGACTIGGRSLGSKLGQYQLAIGPRPPERRTNHGCNPVVCPIPGREGHSSGGGIGCLACKLPACPEQLRGCPTGR